MKKHFADLKQGAFLVEKKGVFPIDNKLKAAVYGLAVADALGVPVEFKERGTFHVTDMQGYGTHHQPVGTWSDDTSMTIATCDSIVKECCIDLDDMRAKFNAWIEWGAYTAGGNVFDYGGTTWTALRDGKGVDHARSNGNGSLMRILPLAFVPDITDEQIREVSAITHAHEISKEACVIYVNIAKKLLAGEKLLDILHGLEVEAPFDRLPAIAECTEDEISSSGYVVDTLEAALWSIATTDSYEAAVLKAVNLGSDTDTVGAVTGGLAGIIYGYDAIPDKWIKVLRGKDVIDSCLF
jgi:ADP-ribosylglycohydrolase